MMGGAGSGLYMGLMALVPLLGLALLIWLIAEIFKGRQAPPPPPAASGPPTPNRGFAILAERYACGEISREEYLERRRDLQELS